MEEEAGLQECNKSSVHRQSAVLTDKLCVAGEFGMPSTLSDRERERERQVWRESSTDEILGRASQEQLPSEEAWYVEGNSTS